MSLHLKRAYAEPDPEDGFRVLVDRLWPRGVSKERAGIALWMKEIAPSAALRKEFHKTPERWEDFKREYFRELDDNPGMVKELIEKARKGPLTLVFAARDEERNNAAALREYLEKKLEG